MATDVRFRRHSKQQGRLRLSALDMCAGCGGQAAGFLELGEVGSAEAWNRAPVCVHCQRYYDGLIAPYERQNFLRDLAYELRRRGGK